MNEHAQSMRDEIPGVVRPATRAKLPWPETTQAAEGMPRRPWRRAEIEAMVTAGIIDEDERFELIGGEMVPMSPKGARHEWVKVEINQHLQRIVPSELWIFPETTLWLDDKTFVEPDFCVTPRAVGVAAKRGHDVLLAVEIADTSLAYDLGRKVAIYAAYGVAEVWVINALTLQTRVFRQLGAEGYRSVADVAPNEALVAVRAPQISVRLDDLGLTPL